MTILFGLNLVSGYLAMLVVMTYSIELFICVVIGLCFGHFIFNTKSAVGESVDPCCTSQQQTTSASGMAQDSNNDHMAISRTPCQINPVQSSHSNQHDMDEEAGLTENITQSTSSAALLIDCCETPNRPPPTTACPN